MDTDRKKLSEEDTSLCDELESKLTAARERAERLEGAVVGEQAASS